jgi:DNA-binding IscR family transcriptional regulator
MQLSRGANDAVRALVHLATLPEGRRASREAIGRACGIDPWTVGWVFRRLTKAGIVDALQGPGCGTRLACGPAELTVLRVVEVAARSPIAGEVSPVEPDLDRFPDCDVEAIADLDARLDEVCQQTAALARGRLAGVTLADLLPTRRRGRRS